MGHTSYEPAILRRRPWNDGRMVGAKKPLKPKDVWSIRFFLEHEGRFRDRALFDLAIDSKLRGCDIVKVKIGDLVTGGQIRNRATVIQQKTGKPVQFEILEPARSSLLTWLELRGGCLDDFAFPSRIDAGGHLSTRQYARLVGEWISEVGLPRQDYGTHSLRRTKVALVYKNTGNIRAVQIRWARKLETRSFKFSKVTHPSRCRHQGVTSGFQQGAPHWELSGCAESTSSPPASRRAVVSHSGTAS